MWFLCVFSDGVEELDKQQGEDEGKVVWPEDIPASAIDARVTLDNILKVSLVLSRPCLRKNCAKLFLSEFRQTSINFNNFSQVHDKMVEVI